MDSIIDMARILPLATSCVKFGGCLCGLTFKANL